MKIELRDILQVLFVVSLLSSGCSDSNSPADQAGSGPEPGEIDLSEGSEDSKPEAGTPFRINRDSKIVDGAWIMYVKLDSQEAPMGLIEFIPPVPGSDRGRYETVFHPGEENKSLEVASWVIEPESVDVKFKVGSRVQLFQGQIHDGIVFGNLVGGDGICVPARLVRPLEEDSRKVKQEPHLIDGIYEFSDVMKEGADWDDMVKFIEDHPESPLLPNAFYTLVLQARPREIPAEKVEQLFGLIDETTILWGERLKNFVRLNSLLQLANDYRDPELLQAIYESLEGKFEEPVWKESVGFFMLNLKQDIDLALKVDALRQADPQQRSEILEQLQKDAKTFRFNPKLFVTTAEALSATGDREAAIDWYLKLAVVPGLEDRYLSSFDRFSNEVPRPSTRLHEFWKEVHGSEEGLQAARDREYQELLSSYELPEFELPESNGKQVLIELFTGTACRPCIAADLAFTVLRDRLPRDRVVMMQYHIHVPAADPLTCEESAGRFAYYSPKGTPTVVVNGRALETLSGEASFVPLVLQQLTNEIVEELSLDPLLQIDLKVNPGNKGTADFEASVVADEISSRWRLQVALAEGEVKYRGPNGVPLHEMVVRKLFTTSQGLAPEGGSLTFSGTVDPKQIRKDLKQSLATLRERNSVEVEDGPLDLDHLFLVAFVQDSRSHRIRQVVSVPVPSSSNAGSAPE